MVVLARFYICNGAKRDRPRYSACCMWQTGRSVLPYGLLRQLEILSHPFMLVEYQVDNAVFAFACSTPRDNMIVIQSTSIQKDFTFLCLVLNFPHLFAQDPRTLVMPILRLTFTNRVLNIIKLPFSIKLGTGWGTTHLPSLLFSILSFWGGHWQVVPSLLAAVLHIVRNFHATFWTVDLLPPSFPDLPLLVKQEKNKVKWRVSR